MALLPFWDIVLGAPVMVNACRNRAGLQVYEKVSLPLTSVEITSEPAHFSACSQCWEILRRGLANETQVTIDVMAYPPGELDESSLVSKPGPTRYWISRRSDPHCEAFFAHLVPNERDQREFWKRTNTIYDADACIAAQSVTEIVAEYRLSTRRFVEQHGVVTLHVNEATLTRVRDNKVLASDAVLFQGSLIWKLSGTSGGTGVPVCPAHKQLPDGTYTQSIHHATLLRKLVTESG